jgi:two-component system, NtrC family, sensor histidine kinase HydH
MGKINAHLLRVALSHLVRNAIEATPRGGSINLTTNREGEQARLELQDTGKGMPPEVAEQVFTPFYTSKIGGTGLGLVFVRQIVEEHRGTIRIESEVGRGARVIIVLPQRFVPQQSSDFRPVE